jgi:serine/threonine protein kinase/formylglycine-generating enzyme required for sulfatase activity
MSAPVPGPLLLALLAFQRGWLSRERLLEATAMWMSTPGMDVGKLLVEARYLTEAQQAELGAVVAEWEHAQAGKAEPMSPALRETLVALRRPKAVAPELPATARADKYELGEELGRGGVGRVVEATDRDLGRKVALKLMLEDAPGDLIERFRWEARITGRFDHPNIVTVHEVGSLPGTKESFLCMKKIVGRDLGWAIAEGRPLRKLVEAVRDACRAVAYAHSQGVVHRDLKPANIMLGDFGEVLVVDWGLARLLGEEDRPSQLRRASTVAARPGRIAKQEETANLTLEGDILGTPSYMPPEQAMGWLTAIDERSDVYALGATLYQVLTGQPPYDGGTAQEVVTRVVNGKLDPPSKFNASPPELEAICLKAMAYQSTERYQSARDLQTALEAWLEGTTERDRRERLATERLAEGKAALARWRKLSSDAAAAEKQAEEEAKRIAPDAPVAAHAEAFGLEDRARQLELESVQALADADDAFDGALSLLPDHAEARQLKAEVHWERFIDAEFHNDWRGEILARRRVEAFNDGAFTERLRDEGSLSLRTRVYPCHCLVEGRAVKPEELSVEGYHPWSGRRLDGIETDALPELERDAPKRLRVHAASCRAQELAGAEVWAFAYVQEHRLMVPATSKGAPPGPPVPASALDALFGASPFRPRGPGQYLGKTPVARRPWPRGEGILIVVAPGRFPQRVPFEVRRGEECAIEATLFAPEEIPPGHIPVLGGRFRSISETGQIDPPRRDVEVGDAFLAHFPVTCRDYAQWLNALEKRDPGEARNHAPRAAERAGWYWPRGAAGWVVPTAKWLSAAPDSEQARAARLENCGADWDEEWPVLGLSWVDAQHFVRGRSDQTGWLVTTPSRYLWERAARGAGPRRYVWGDYGFPALSCSNQSRPDASAPAPVDSFPWDESPWGIRGLCGNASCYCLSDAGEGYRTWRCRRGSSWNRPLVIGRTSLHQGGVIHGPGNGFGIRTAVAVRLGRQQ